MKERSRLLGIVGVAWGAVTLGAYYWASSSYYVEKLGVFGRFLFGLK